MNAFKWLALSLGLAAGALADVQPALAAETPGSRDGVYQIVKATENKVWRLNTQTGEIAVCALDGDNLICTSTANAAEAPKKSYAQIEAERKAAEAAAEAASRQQRAQDLQLLDKILAFIRELIQTALGNNAGA